MNKDLTRAEYIHWMRRMMTAGTVNEGIYNALFDTLSHTPFYWIVPMDENRYNDGINLRSLFAYEKNLDPEMIFEMLSDQPCSILEMMVALTIRINDIMDDIEQGDRLKSWFWGMIDSLGLYGMTDERYSPIFVEAVLKKFLNREYGNDGRGNLFPNFKDFDSYTKIQIWDQAMYYLNQYI